MGITQAQASHSNTKYQKTRGEALKNPEAK
jgi:hypothetical protein